MFATVAIISGIGGNVVMAAPKTEANLETVAISMVKPQQFDIDNVNKKYK